MSFAAAYPPGPFWLRRFDAPGARFACLLLAIFIYAVAGSPTPDNPGVPEAAIALLLICAAGIPAIEKAFTLKTAGGALLAYGVIVPLMIGAAAGHDARLILRDVIPFLFLLLPVFISGIFEKRPVCAKWLKIAFACLGLAFGVRALLDSGILHGPLSYRHGELLYLANAPSVFFAALWFCGESGRRFAGEFTFAALAVFAGAVILALAPLAAMALSLERAGIGAAFIYFAALCALGFWFFPYRTAVLLALAALAVAPFYSHAAWLFEILARKTEIHGFNNRLQEAAAVWAQASANPAGLLFGEGWGGTFQSPAVAGIRVNFTHCLLTSLLLKTGLAGLGLGLAYLWGFARKLAALVRKDGVLGLALAAPFLIDVFLYGSYKSLDFGLLLLLIAAV